MLKFNILSIQMLMILQFIDCAQITMHDCPKCPCLTSDGPLPNGVNHLVGEFRIIFVTNYGPLEIGNITARGEFLDCHNTSYVATVCSNSLSTPKMKSTLSFQIQPTDTPGIFLSSRQEKPFGPFEEFVAHQLFLDNDYAGLHFCRTLNKTSRIEEVFGYTNTTEAQPSFERMDRLKRHLDKFGTLGNFLQLTPNGC